jgi:hypothetical protein
METLPSILNGKGIESIRQEKLRVRSPNDPGKRAVVRNQALFDLEWIAEPIVCLVSNTQEQWSLSARLDQQCDGPCGIDGSAL